MAIEFSKAAGGGIFPVTLADANEAGLKAARRKPLRKYPY